MGETQNQELPPCLIHIDKEGRWYHNGVEMIRRDLVQLFYQNMLLASGGQYVIDWNDERCLVDVEDTAHVVRRVVCESGERGPADRIILYLSDDTREELAPDTLFVGEENVLYCNVHGGTFPARFNRPSYYQLAEYIEEEGGVYYLTVRGKKHSILMEDHAVLNDQHP